MHPLSPSSTLSLSLSISLAQLEKDRFLHNNYLHTYVHSSNPPIVTFKPNVRANTSKRVAYFKNTHCIYLNLLVSFSLSHCSFLYRTHRHISSHSLTLLRRFHFPTILSKWEESFYAKIITLFAEEGNFFCVTPILRRIVKKLFKKQIFPPKIWIAFLRLEQFYVDVISKMFNSPLDGVCCYFWEPLRS